MLDDTTPTQGKLSSIFGLDRYAPKALTPTWVIRQAPPRTAADQPKQAEDQLIPKTWARRHSKTPGLRSALRRA